MKGVTFVQVKLHPLAACDECAWTRRGSYTTPAVTVRSQAQHHVKDTGHTVNVEIRDITQYAPEATS